MGRWLLAFLAGLLVAGCAHHSDPRPNVLIFTHSTGYRHASIEPGSAMLADALRARGYRVAVRDDLDVITDAGLAPFDAVVLLSTTTDPADPASEFLNSATSGSLRGEAFGRWYVGHGAVVGIHAAADSHYRWPWYGQMLGSRFERHPPGTPAARLRAAPGWGYPAAFELEDEWYQLKDVANDVTPVVTLDPASIAGEPAGPPRVVAYTREFAGGRIFYTSLGHRTETYADPRFEAHVAAGLAWALAR